MQQFTPAGVWISRLIIVYNLRMAERDDEAQEAVRAAIEHLEGAMAGNPVSILDSMDLAFAERETDLFSTKFLSECVDMVTCDTDPKDFSPKLLEKFKDFTLAYEIRKRFEGDYKTADLVSCLAIIDIVPTIRNRIGGIAGVVRENEAMLFAMRRYGVILESIRILREEPSYRIQN